MNKLKINNFLEKVNFVAKEHDVLDFWDTTQIFEKSVTMRPEDKRYVFYDGPPFATGLPHYGHILTSVIKDAIPRYWTMKGYRVDRVWGWDCHGIPIENMIEKELGLKGGKKGIEDLGIDKFNAACRAAILRFDSEWEKIIRRIGRWVDFKHSYKTMDRTFMESVWWAFKTLYEKNHVYQGRKVILYCPRCATPLSNFEIAMDNSYKNVEDNSVFVKFKRKDKTNEYFLAWTTTPWTLIGNVALAVKPDASYIKVKLDQDYYWVAEERLEIVGKKEEKKPEIVETVKGINLVGLEYEPLYTYMPLDDKKAHYITDGSFVSLEDGTGIVHTAAIYGEDDYKLAVEKDLPRMPTLDDQGRFFDFVTPLAGIFYKKSENWVIEDLSQRNLMFLADKIVHSYPFCYRCETPLYYNAVPAWFINIQQVKQDLLKANEHINWYPEYLKHGRFGKGLETAPDWNISRSRYWGTPMPIWESSQPSAPSSQPVRRIIGSVEELQKWAVNPQTVKDLTDIHREFLDDIEVWVDDEKTVKGKRIPEVFDCWVESGSMPYASIHYPFEHKKQFDSSHPAQFIVEYISQTRAWFYTLHVMSVGLFGTHTFENALTHGVILAEDGTKMSKSKKNYPDPSLLFEKYGVDALRFYLISSVVMKAENLNFSEKGVAEVYQRVVSLLWNTFSFYKLYCKDTKSSVVPSKETLTNDLDRWIVSKTHRLVKEVTEAMDAYDTIVAARVIVTFVDELSTWYLRRSRDRFKKNTESMNVFGWVLETLTFVVAPIIPFLAELMYQNLRPVKESVHLEDWPSYDKTLLDEQLEREVELSRTIVEGLHAIRKKNSVAVKQALGLWSFTGQHATALSKVPDIFQSIEEETNVRTFVPNDKKLEDWIKGENVQEVTLMSKNFGEVRIYLDLTITPELDRERKVRELIRSVQVARKEQGMTVEQAIILTLPKEFESFEKSHLDQIQQDTVASKILWGDSLKVSIG